ncbi:MAG TPA: (2Fe-2S) ferredoxin domain-containing protein [Kamptonema sp.]|nr:(2Fe-2S) ferredoxin domain-containing protein [Kamptonema sp.]
MCKSRKDVSEFSLEGQILGFIVEDGYKLKYLRIAAPSGEEYVVKISKQLRSPLAPVLAPGLAVRVVGEKKLNWETGKIKLKAYSVVPLTGDNLPTGETQILAGASFGRQTEVSPFACGGQLPCDRLGTIAPTPTNSSQNKAKILVCQKSDCQKRGGRAVCQALEAALSDRGLKDQVTIQGTGCLKQCKAGPNMVLMPDKTRYSRIEPTEIPAIIEKHFAHVCV